MTPAPLSKLPRSERQTLLNELNYLNTSEIKSFCRRHSIPYSIFIETKDGKRRRTAEDDRKGIVLQRIRHFLRTGIVLPETCFCASVVCLDSLREELTADDRLFYGQYDKRNCAVIARLQELTDGHFRNGAIARILMRDFWSNGMAPTFREFAGAWLQASKEHTEPNPEWAFLSDRAHRRAPADWKELRAQKAAKVIKTLYRIAENDRSEPGRKRINRRKGAGP